MPNNSSSNRGVMQLWDIWCLCSIIGIWPRFIEPKLIFLSTHTLPIPNLPQDLIGIKILQLSDLHWHANFPQRFLDKLSYRIQLLKPDLIVFTGDFLCRSVLEEEERLVQFLCSLEAKLGCFAVLGNHDYEQFITVDGKGNYDVEEYSSTSDIVKGFKRLMQKNEIFGNLSERVKSVGLHSHLMNLLKLTPFKVLNNENQLVSYKGSFLNICGLEEYTLGRLNLQKAYHHYNPNYPGIILVHHPDALSEILHYPGDLILMGHTHGGQINLPWIWKKMTRIKDPYFRKGLKKRGDKWAYINRGIGSVMPFRWFAPPELSLFILQEG